MSTKNKKKKTGYQPHKKIPSSRKKIEHTIEIDVEKIKKLAKKNKLTKKQFEKRILGQKKKSNDWIYYVLFIIFSVLIGISSYKLFTWNQDNVKIRKLQKELNNEVKYEYHTEIGSLINPPIEVTDSPVENKPLSDYWYYASLPFYDVDFTDLLKKNEDTVAWINMNNTNINYPIVQTSDNDFYLNHAYDKSENDAGWVYMDYRNSFEENNDNIVIYGHGRLDNTVFGSLKKALKKKWQEDKDNLVINISTPNKNYLYQIFSIYVIESESYYITTNFYYNEDKQKWIDTMKERNESEVIEVPVDINDKFLTLSTCYNNDGMRIVVQAKLIKTSS